ncbi:peptidyl-tRNA hydrolase 2, mitochondrial [Toxorhynchites rutilus septentrionalis]|uniref:peptidyl-tRNA hydrolase 2, mitochondrial n=1 Tax=Toxorhynchites rutilus septentrionalis TaxID=329112 RepID=UPI00247A9207|nr:peptidyl-tRNA hydrolase 2, mitochondrial [Toxorhynchites rutilus septentrionalis]
MGFLKTLISTSIGGPTKMVLVVRSDLGLGKGKIASQCAHAAVMSYMKSASVSKDKLELWLAQGQPKIVAKIDNLQEMKQIAAHAREKSVVAEIVKDAGKTQVGCGTETVLALGPDSSEVIDALTGHLKLL